MTSIDHGRLVRGLIPALVEAGRIEMAYFQAGVSVEHKSDRSPVTAADREAEACLLQALGELSPGVPVVAEEEVAEGRVPELGPMFFLVDPLDGTREFIAGRPEFTINVGMVMDGHPRFGMLYVPATGELFATTGKDSAAWTTLPVGTDPPEFEKLAWKSLSGRVPNPADLVAVESRSHRSPETEMLLAEKGVARALKIGSALKFGVLARGDADLYLRLGATGEWDTAAGQAIVEAAGGLVTDLDGDPLVYGKTAQRFINQPFIAWSRRPSAVASGQPKRN